MQQGWLRRVVRAGAVGHKVNISKAKPFGADNQPAVRHSDARSIAGLAADNLAWTELVNHFDEMSRMVYRHNGVVVRVETRGNDLARRLGDGRRFGRGLLFRR
jgi:hypothetical protein